jgi:hypothetical protein
MTTRPIELVGLGEIHDFFRHVITIDHVENESPSATTSTTRDQAQIPTASTRMCASPGPGLGMGTSSKR